jgi:hypothetical protein
MANKDIVLSWDLYVTNFIALLPVVLSFSVSVVWSVVASVHFKADVQASTQTGFAIGSYVVTAGMLKERLIPNSDCN